jgi:hypothetical protein
MGTILSSVKQTVNDAKERMCGISNLFAYEQALSETVITNFEFEPFDAEDHYKRAEFYYSDNDPPNAKLR